MEDNTQHQPLMSTYRHTWTYRTYTKYTYTGATKRLFWFLLCFIHGICLYTCSFVYMCMCTYVWKVNIDVWYLALSLSTLFPWNGGFHWTWSFLIWLDCLASASQGSACLLPSVEVTDMEYHLLPASIYESWEFKLNSFCFKVVMALYPQSYLLCPNLCFKYIRFHWFSFASKGVTFLII